MSGKIPSRRERLRRAEELSEKLKDQYGRAEEIYNDIRDVINMADPSIIDYQLPEAIVRLSAETMEFREQWKAFTVEVEALKEEILELETQRQILTKELQDTQITNEEPEQLTKDRLAAIKSLFETDSKLAALVFEDQPLFQDTIRDIKDRGDQIQNKMHHLLEDVQSVNESLLSAKQDYEEQLTNLVEPLRQELHDTKQQLEDSEALGLSTDEELAQVKEDLWNEKQERQTSEMALRNEIDEHKAEIKRLRTEAETSTSQNTQLQTEIQRLESQNGQQENTIDALRVSRSQQTFQHDAEIQAMIAEKKNLSDRNDELETDINALQDTLKEIEETLSHDIVQLRGQVNDTQADNEQLQAQVDAILADNDTLDTRVIQAEALNRALQSEKDTLYTRTTRNETRIQNLDAEIGNLTGRISHLEAQIHELEAEKDGLIDRNDAYEQRIQALNNDHQEKVEFLEASKSNLADQIYELRQEQSTFIDNHDDEVQRLEKDKDALKDQIRNLDRDMSNLSIQHEQKQAQIKDLEANVQILVKQCDDQSIQQRQHLEEISQLKSNLEIQENTLQETINNANEERTLSLQEIQQLQHFLFSKLLSIQNDQSISLPTASGNRLHFKRQQLSISQDTLAQWIQGPLDSLTNSTEDTPNSAETYQQVLGSLIYLQSSSDIQDKESLLECMGKLQIWLTKACKDRTSILGLALARVINVIQEGPQSDPWFSTNQFDASRTIDSRNSELPQTTSIIADGCPGIVLVVQGTNIHVCEATDIFMRQQRSCGMQLVFNEALNLSDLQLLADSWPHIDRWEPLAFWAVEVGRFNAVMKLDRIYKPEQFKEA